MANRNLVASDYPLLARIALNHYSGGDIRNFEPEEGETPEVTKEYERIVALCDVYGGAIEFFADKGLETAVAKSIEKFIEVIEAAASATNPEAK